MNKELNSKYTISSVDKALSVLQVFVNVGKPLTLTEICNYSGLHKTTALRIVHTLLGRNFLKYDSKAKTYYFGFEVLKMGLRAIDSTDLLSVAEPILKRLANETGIVALLGVFEKNNVLIVSRQIPENLEHRVQLISRAGVSIPIYCTGIGLLFLAHKEEDTAKQILSDAEIVRHTTTTEMDQDKIWEHVLKIKEDKFALNNGQHDEGIISYCFPIYDYNNKMIAGMSLGGVRELISFPNINKNIFNKTSEAARQISLELGWKGDR